MFNLHICSQKVELISKKHSVVIKITTISSINRNIFIVHMCMKIKIVLCSPLLVGFRLLTLSLKEHDPITKLHGQLVSKYCLNNTYI